MKGLKTGGGSRKGILNKTTVEIKQAISFAYKKLGGDDGLAEWAMENPELFYTKIFVKLVPTKIDADINMQITPASILEAIRERSG